MSSGEGELDRGRVSDSHTKAGSESAFYTQQPRTARGLCTGDGARIQTALSGLDAPPFRYTQGNPCTRRSSATLSMNLLRKF